MALFLAGAWLCNKIHPTPKRDEIILGGMPISRTPCLSFVDELFGKGVDSNKACDCLLPAYYRLVKDDPEELTKFDYTGIHMLPGHRNDQVNQILSECIGNNIVDSTYIIHLPEAYANRLRQQLADRLRSDTTYKSYNPDSLASCVVSRLNDRLTVPDYIGLSQWTVARAKALIQPCITPHQ